MRESGGRGLVALVGVQTNQFPRAMDIAKPLRAAGIQVCIGGFHVSGTIAMLPELRITMHLKSMEVAGVPRPFRHGEWGVCFEALPDH